MTLIVNLYGGPGAGKSTLAYELAGSLKRNGINAELVVEYAKKLAYKGSMFGLNDQIFLTAQHNHNLRMLVDKVDVVICDCSFLNALIYTTDEERIEKQLAIDLYNRYNNIGFIIPRKTSAYIKAGRTQTEEEARELDNRFLWEIQFLPEKERLDIANLKPSDISIKDFVYEKIIQELNA